MYRDPQVRGKISFAPEIILYIEEFMIWEKSDMVDFIIYSFYNYFIKRVQRGT